MGMCVCLCVSVNWVAKETGWGIERPFTLIKPYLTALLRYITSNLMLIYYW